MLLNVFKKSKNIFRLAGISLLLGFAQPAWAAGPPAPSVLNNPLAVSLIVLMILLLIIIGILANILLGAADFKLGKNKRSMSVPAVASIMAFFLLSSGSLFAQNGTGNTEATTTAAGTIGGLTATTFYIMASVIFLELTVIIILLFNIKFLLKIEREKATETKVLTIAEKRTRLSWWDKFNKLRPVTQESELDLGHDYDGIRELNNRLPPWWLYGFYLTIIIAGIYLWRYHVSHTAPSSKEEFEREVASADLKVSQYLKTKGENIDENTVVFLSDKAELDAGKKLYTNGPCVTCHGTDGSGIVFGQPGVGPNLTDDYWINGGSVKSIFSTIKFGVTGKGMQPWASTYSPKEIAQITSYIKSLYGSKPSKAKDPQGDLYVEESNNKPAADSLKTQGDSLKPKENKVAMN